MTMREVRITLYPVGREARYPDLSCTGEGTAQQGRDPSERAGRLLPWMSTVTRLSWLTSAVIARGRSQTRTQHGADGDDAGGQIAPQRHHQFARQGDNGNTPDASFEIAHALVEPARQRACWLMNSP
jgi:hypothetical protein